MRRLVAAGLVAVAAPARPRAAAVAAAAAVASHWTPTAALERRKGAQVDDKALRLLNVRVIGLTELAAAAAAVRALTGVVVCGVRVRLQKQVQHEVHFRR